MLVKETNTKVYLVAWFEDEFGRDHLGKRDGIGRARQLTQKGSGAHRWRILLPDCIKTRITDDINPTIGNCDRGDNCFRLLFCAQLILIKDLAPCGGRFEDKKLSALPCHIN